MCYADVRDLASFPGVVDWAGSLLEGEGLNVLVNNAGVAHWEGFEDVTREKMLDCLESNCISPLMMAKVVCVCALSPVFLCYICNRLSRDIVLTLRTVPCAFFTNLARLKFDLS